MLLSHWLCQVTKPVQIQGVKEASTFEGGNYKGYKQGGEEFMTSFSAYQGGTINTSERHREVRGLVHTYQASDRARTHTRQSGSIASGDTHCTVAQLPHRAESCAVGRFGKNS